MRRSGFGGVFVLMAFLLPVSAPRARPSREQVVAVDRLEITSSRGQAGVRVAAGGAKPRRSAGPVADLQIEFSRKRAIVGDPKPVTITVRAFDAAGNPTDGEIFLDTDVGEVSALVRREVGVYSATLPLPSVLGEVPSIFVLARSGAISTNATLLLAPSAPATLEVDAPDSLAADGSTSYPVAVKVTDAFGNPAEDVPEGRSEYGDFGPAKRLAPGSWLIDYRPRRLAQDAKDIVQVRAGPSTASRAVQLVAPMVSFVLGPKIGLALGGGGTSVAFGAEVALWTRIGSEQLGLALAADSFTRGSTASAPAPATTLKSDQSYLPLTLSLAWRHPIGQRVMVWLSAGAGTARVSNTSTLDVPPQTVSESGWALTGSFAGALGLRAWQGYTFLEVRWLPMSSAALKTLSGSISPILLQVGYRFDAG